MSPVALHCIVEGSPDAPALVLAPSLGTTLSLWTPLLPELSRAFRVVRLDHRGHGSSPAPAGPYSMDDLGGDVLALLDRLQIARASFAGVSLGGMVCTWVATHAPERVDRLALVCTSAYLPSPEGWPARAALVRAQGTGAVVDTVVARWFTPSFVARQPETVAAIVRAFKKVDPEGYAGCCEAIGGWDERGRLGSISAPTLVVAGGADPSTPPSHAYLIAAGVPGARVAVIEGAAHLAVIERSRAVARLLLAHLGARGAGQAGADPDRAGRGEAIRRAVLGDAHVDRARAAASGFSAPFQDLVNRFPWGDIWGRAGLGRAERSIVTLSVLAALGHEHELGMHVVAALGNGLTAEEIREVLLHVGAYAGIPVANRALAVAEKALGDADAL